MNFVLGANLLKARLTFCSAHILVTARSSVIKYVATLIDFEKIVDTNEEIFPAVADGYV